MIHRRLFLWMLAAPFIVRVSAIMPISVQPIGDGIALLAVSHPGWPDDEDVEFCEDWERGENWGGHFGDLV